MIGICRIAPGVRRPDGTEIDAPLYTKLMSLVHDRQTALDLYYSVKTPAAMSVMKPALDEFGDPTFESLITNKQFANKLGKDVYAKVIEAQTGVNINATYDNAQVAAKEAEKINNSAFGENNVAVHVEKSVGIQAIKVLPKSPKTEALHEAIKTSDDIREKIYTTLAGWGISVGELNALDKKLGVNGITDTARPARTAEGLVELIRVAKGEKETAALTEEFAHVAYKALKSTGSPLCARLENMLSDEAVLREVLGEDYEAYEEKYHGEKSIIIEEAIGKLISEAISTGNMRPGPQKTILGRIIDAIKDFFSKFNPSPLEEQIARSKAVAASIAYDALNNNIKTKAEKIIATGADTMYQIDNENYETSDEVVEDPLYNMLKDVIEVRITQTALEQKQLDVVSAEKDEHIAVEALQDDLIDAHYEIGISKAALQSTQRMERAINFYNKLKESEKSTPAGRFKSLRRLKIYADAAARIYDIMDKRKINEIADEKIREAILARLNTLEEQIKTAREMFQKNAKEEISEMFAQAIPNGKESTFNDDKRVDIDALLDVVDKDTGWCDHFLLSMAESRNDLLKAFDRISKEAKEKARLKTEEDIDEIKRLGKLLEREGYKNTDWAYERNAEGIPTGYLLTRIDRHKFLVERKEAMQRFKAELNPDGTAAGAAKEKRAMKDWLNEHATMFNGEWCPKSEYYSNPEFANLSKVQQQFIERMLEIKEELDAQYPTGSTIGNRAPIVQKSFTERLIANGPSKAWETLSTSIKDSLIDNEFDTEYGDVDVNVLMDFQKKTVKKRPIFYNSIPKDKTKLRDLSTDLVSSMICYAAKANEYGEMSKIIDGLEVAKDYITEFTGVNQKKGSHTLRNVAKVGNASFESDARLYGKSGMTDKLNDWFDMQVYGQYTRSEGQLFGSKISLAKAADASNWWTSLRTFAANGLAAVSNVLAGKIQTYIEAAGGKYFGFSNYMKAGKILAENIPGVLADCGSRTKTNKLWLMMDKFNVLQDFESEVNEVDWHKKSRFSRLFSGSLMYAGNTMGEFMLQSRSALAMLDKDSLMLNGESISIYDAYEVKYFTEKEDVLSDEDQGLGGKLVLKPGVTKKDGSAFTQDDIIAQTLKMKSVNQKMHGIYNKVDRNIAQSYAAGRMAIMFRKWIVPSVMRRFGSSSINSDTGEWEQGYYNTCWTIINRLRREIQAGEFKWAAFKDQLTEDEIANVKKAMFELCTMLSLFLIKCYGFDDDDKDKKKTYLESMVKYQCCRLYTEIGALTPTPAILTEAMTIVKSPTADIDTWESFTNILDIFAFWNWGDTYETGKHKGESKLKWDLLKMFPYIKPIESTLDPESKSRFFDNK